MNDNNDKKLPIPTGKAPESDPRPRLWPLWLLIALLVITSGGLGLAAWEQYRNQHHMAERLDKVEQRTESVRSDQQQAHQSRDERLNRMESKLDEQSERLHTQTRQIEHNARSLLGLGQRTRTDWLLAEAEYLIRLANQRLMFEGDYRGALKMLESADQVLAETDDVGSYPVREQLAEDILALRAIEPVDRTGIYLQLEAAMGMADELGNRQLRQPAATEPRPQPSEEGAREGITDWASAWERVRETFSGVVTIRRLDDPVRPLLSPEQETQARLHLQLMMEEAALALLRSDEVTYQRALKRARNWLNDWYDPQQNQVEALDELLSNLSGQRIDPVLPDITQSLDRLKSRIQLRLDELTDGGDEAPEDDGNSDSGEPAS